MSLEARLKIHEEAKARMLTIGSNQPVTNVCAGENNPHRHSYFQKLVIKQHKNKHGIVFTDYYARCHLRDGKGWNTDIKVIFPGHLSIEESRKIFHPIWEAEYR